VRRKLATQDRERAGHGSDFAGRVQRRAACCRESRIGVDHLHDLMRGRPPIGTIERPISADVRLFRVPSRNEDAERVA
jgi:hypothetical protein